MTTEKNIRRILEEMTGQSLENITSDQDLPDSLGLNSLAGLKMLATIEKKCDVVFPNERLAELRTLEALTNEIDKSS